MIKKEFLKTHLIGNLTKGCIGPRSIENLESLCSICYAANLRVSYGVYSSVLLVCPNCGYRQYTPQNGVNNE